LTDPVYYYASQGPISDPGRHASALENLPTDIRDLCEVVQGLIIQPGWAQFYGWTVAKEQEDDLQLRLVRLMLGRVLELDNRPLTLERPPEARLGGNCRDHTMLLVAMLRHQGVPARARCGFGAYFLPGKYEDHWVCEYWHPAEERWQLCDAQLNARQCEILRIDFDTCDVPRDRFIVAGQAWQMCRAGEADPDAFGLTAVNEHGRWWVRQNLVRDAAALNKMEMLPWDGWGLAWDLDDSLPTDQELLLDRVAILTQAEGAFWELRATYEGEVALRVPSAIRSYRPGGARLVEVPAGAA